MQQRSTERKIFSRDAPTSQSQFVCLYVLTSSETKLRLPGISFRHAEADFEYSTRPLYFMRQVEMGLKKVFAVVGNSVIFPVVPVACIARCALARKCAESAIYVKEQKCVYVY